MVRNILDGKKSILIGLVLLALGTIISACNMGDAARSVSVLGDELERICAQEELMVNTTEDTNDAVCNDTSCSLREAVVQANTCDSDQTIVLTHSAYELTRHGLNEDIARSGDLDITAPVTIRGEGNPIIDGQEAVRIFDVRLEEGGTVVFENLTMQDGRAESQGGALRIRSGDVELRNAVVRNSQAGAEGDPGAGGGIFLWQDNTLSLIGSEVSGNRVYGEGGGIFAFGRSTLNVDADSSVVFNEALDGYSGGGIYSRGDAVVSGQIVQNRSTWAGGGVANVWEMEIRDAEIRDNSTTDGVGGGVSNTGELRVVNSQLQSNTADDGGGLYSYANPRWAIDPRTTLVDVRFEDNEASRAGGALFNGNESLMVGTRVEAAQNQAQWGAGIFNAGEAYLIAPVVSSNRAVESAGGLDNVGNAVIRRGEFSFNEAGEISGGVANEGNLEIEESTLVGNQEGAIWNAGSLTVRRSTLKENTSTSNEGGSAVMAAAGHGNLFNVTISGNQVEGERGSILWSTEGSLALIHATVMNNTGGNATAQSVYGGISFNNSIVMQADEPVCLIGARSDGHNLMSDDSCVPTEGDQLVESAAEVGVLPLGDYGGTTETHALTEASPAIDRAGDTLCRSVDQRGEARPVGDACDIGAFEGFEEGSPRSSEIDVNFNADRYTIERNECTTLRWAVTGADTITLLGTEREPTEAQEVCPDETTGYTLIAENAADQIQSFLEIEVTEPTFSGGPDQSCLHQYDNENFPTCYEVCPVENPNPGGSCTP